MKIKLAVFILLAAVTVSGCVSVEYPAVHDKGFPPGGEYEILGTVWTEGTTTVILGVFWTGGVRYMDLLGEARKKFGQKTDDVVNVSVDKNVFSILGIVTRVNILLRGIAIRYVTTPEGERE